MSDGLIRYAAAACQTDFANPIDRAQMRVNTDRMLAMIDAAVAGSAPFLPVRLIVFPEFAHAAPVFATVAELLEKLAVPIPNEHTDRLAAKAREHDVYVQSGTMIEADPRWPGVVFNTTCLIGPGGILAKYRKVNPWIPYEVHASPHDVPGYDEPLFPVADTPIGRLGCAICYDWLFPEALRQLAANGAEVLIRVSAYMDPWGATEPMDWWTVINRARAIENMAYVVAANQGASLRHYPPYSWPGGSQVVDFDGRLLAEASPGPGERIVVAPIDLSALRHERATRRGHHMLAHLRTEAYPVYRRHIYPPVPTPRRQPVRHPHSATKETSPGSTPPSAASSRRGPRPDTTARADRRTGRRACRRVPVTARRTDAEPQAETSACLSSASHRAADAPGPDSAASRRCRLDGEGAPPPIPNRQVSGIDGVADGGAADARRQFAVMSCLPRATAPGRLSDSSPCPRARGDRDVHGVAYVSATAFDRHSRPQLGVELLLTCWGRCIQARADQSG